jgi:hypothetical protein
MAAPNLVNTSTITGKTAYVSLSAITATSLLSNPAASGKVFKVEQIVVANIDTSSAVNVTVNYYSAAALGGTAYPICSTIAVPANASLIVIDKTTGIYLEEDKSIGVTAGTANKLTVTCAYEELY